MPEFKETVTTRQDNGVDETGAPVQQNTRRVNTKEMGDKRSTAENAVWFVVGTIEVLLGLRLLLKVLGANPTSGFVEFIYGLSGVLTAPFDNIFGVTSSTAGEVDSVFEPSILVAMAVYALLGWGLVKLLNLNRPVQS